MMICLCDVCWSNESLDLRYTCPIHPIMLYWYLKWVTNVTWHHEQRADTGNGQQIPVFLLVPARCCDTSPYLNLPLCISRWWSLINKILLHLHSLVLSRQTFQYLCLLKKEIVIAKWNIKFPENLTHLPILIQFGTRIWDNIFKCIFFDEHILILIKI